MDKIYSRTKIRLPSIKTIKSNNRKISKIYFIVLTLIISTITVYTILKLTDPIFEGLCVEKARRIATDLTNRKSSEVLAKYNYQDTVKIIKSEDEKNSVLKTDIVTLNQIISEIAIEIQNELDDLGRQNVEIPMGALTGSQYLAGSGPKIKIRIISAGNIITDIRTEFKATGINQTLYRIYLNLECNISILTSYKTIKEKVENQVLLVETVLVGEVPETYLQLEK